MSKQKINLWFGLILLFVGFLYAGPVIAGHDENDSVSLAGKEGMPTDMFVESDGDDLPQAQTLQVGDYGQIELHVKDLELTKVLQLLSIQSQRNVIASRNVAGTISADLYGVDFYEALDAILHTNGFGWEEKGQFIYVYTSEELQKIQHEQRQVITKVIWLNYINASEASVLVSPLLSSSGAISVSAEPSSGYEATTSDGGADSNAHPDRLVVVDYPENVEQILDLLAELDIQPPQVLVEATVLQARLTEANAFGVDFALFADLDITNFANPLAAVNELIGGENPAGAKYNSGSAINSTAGNVLAGQSSVKIGVVGQDAAVFVRALDSVTDTIVLAAPKVMVLNRQRAKLLVGEKLGYLSLQQTETASTQTVEFLEVGTELSVRPFVSNDGMIRLELRPSVSDGDTTRIVDGFVIPDESTQELLTNVMVRSGSTVVLGGLFKEDSTVGRRQVPLLGDMGWAGTPFRGQDDTVIRNEVIFLIKPTIMKDDSLIAIGERVKSDVELKQLASRDGLLPWSRTRMTSSHMIQATNARDAGDSKKALWHANMALHLDPNLTDALRIKEEITAQKMNFHDFSILRNAIDREVNDQVGEAGEIEAIETIDAFDAIGHVPNTVGSDANILLETSGKQIRLPSNVLPKSNEGPPLEYVVDPEVWSPNSITEGDRQSSEFGQISLESNRESQPSTESDEDIVVLSDGGFDLQVDSKAVPDSKDSVELVSNSKNHPFGVFEFENDPFEGQDGGGRNILGVREEDPIESGELIEIGVGAEFMAEVDAEKSE